MWLCTFSCSKFGALAALVLVLAATFESQVSSRPAKVLKPRQSCLPGAVHPYNTEPVCEEEAEAIYLCCSWLNLPRSCSMSDQQPRRSARKVCNICKASRIPWHLRQPSAGRLRTGRQLLYKGKVMSSEPEPAELHSFWDDSRLHIFLAVVVHGRAAIWSASDSDRPDPCPAQGIRDVLMRICTLVSNAWRHAEAVSYRGKCRPWQPTHQMPCSFLTFCA